MWLVMGPRWAVVHISSSGSRLKMTVNIETSSTSRRRGPAVNEMTTEVGSAKLNIIIRTM